jgi:DNA repair exonuclease SbcCD ATPase subunit
MDKLTPTQLRDIADTIMLAREDVLSGADIVRHQMASSLREEAARREADAKHPMDAPLTEEEHEILDKALDEAYPASAATQPASTSVHVDPALLTQGIKADARDELARDIDPASPPSDPQAEQLHRIADKLKEPRRLILLQAADRIEANARKIAEQSESLDMANGWLDERQANIEALEKRVAELEAALRWNKQAQHVVDRLLAQAGYSEDSSARHNLSMMNFDAIAGAANG